MAEDAEPWNHNAHYHPVIINAVATGCQRALDVGCGTGTLTRQLRHLLPHVTGIDLDRRSIELARCHPEAGDIDYLLGDFLSFPLEPESYDLITSVASLHHMDVVAALQRMCDLLRPGGVLVVIGLARGGSLFDLALNVPAVILTRVCQTTSLTARPLAETYQSPTIWPPPKTYQSMRRIAGQVLPGVRYCRHLLWRYSLVWAKPG